MVTDFRPALPNIPPGSPPGPGRPFAVLIADDDKGNREALAEILDRHGFRTVTAADGGQAVELVQVEFVHLVLFDMHMPRLTGLEALAVLRSTLDRVLPALLMTADASTELMRQAFQAQVFSVIPKPVNPNVVVHTLTRALHRVYGPPPKPADGPPPAIPHPESDR